MTPQLKHTEVLIVGAGPSGLMMAAQLLRFGIQPMIIDSKAGPTDKTKALAVQARSMEIYRQLGVVDQVLKGGKPAAGLHFKKNDEELAAFKTIETAEGETAYPYLFMYPQSNNERTLLDYLTSKACTVYWNSTLVKLDQKDNVVNAVIKNEGDEYVLSCNWVIGADGTRSEVRKQLNVAFIGDTYPRKFYLIDAVTNTAGDFIDLHLGKHGICGLFPLPAANEWRVIGNLPDNLTDKEDVELQDVIPFFREIVGEDIRIRECKWLTTYRLHHRMAEKFRLNRCFLIGDAAHIHSPVGGQGMNTGLQDAYNLAWKLAGVIKGEYNGAILESYSSERMPVARELLKTTDRVFNVVMARNLFADFFKTAILPRILKYLWSKPGFRKAFFKRISQIGINYRHSGINLHLSQSTRVKAGDRLPYVKIYDEKQQVETDLHAWCAKTGFTLIVLGRLSESDLFAIAKWLTQTYKTTVNFFYLPYSVKNHKVFDTFETQAAQKKSIIVRPDMYIGFMKDVIDMEMMDNYLENTAGLIKT